MLIDRGGRIQPVSAPPLGITATIWLRLLVWLLLAVALYWGALGYMLKIWQTEDFNYCFFVPLIVGYLIWEQRTQLSALPIIPARRGILAILAALGLFWLGELGGEYTLLFISFWLLLTGVLWMELGWAKLRPAAVPLVLLLGMFPPPSMLASGLTLKLKLFSSFLGVRMLQLYGMSAYREGNVIDLGFTRLQVVDACSGLRFFFPLLLLACVLAYYFRDRTWKRLLLAVSAIPISIVTNGFRIALVGVLYPFFGTRVVEGFFHDFSGWFIFMMSLVILLGEILILKRIHRKSAVEPRIRDTGDFSEPALQVPGGIVPPLPQLLAALLLSASLILANTVHFKERIPLKQPFATFPEQLDVWHGKRNIMEQVYIDALGLADYLLVDFKNSRGDQINLYVAYNESQAKGKSTHSPATCLPGGGWHFRESEIITVDLPGGARMPVQRAVMEKNGQQQLSYFWFPQRGRILNSLYELKLYAFWDALTKQRTDGALVRISTPISSYETPQLAEERMQKFVQQVLPVLDRFIPGRKL